MWMLQRNSGSISIHAPTRGATLFTMPFRHGPCISIHAPTRGATCCGMICCGNCCYFNPRSYKRSDCDDATSHCRFKNFNPRSYKRSDCSSTLCCLSHQNFNPRSYKRSDYVFSLRYFNCRLFQSTLLQEERPPGLQH